MNKHDQTVACTLVLAHIIKALEKALLELEFNSNPEQSVIDALGDELLRSLCALYACAYRHGKEATENENSDLLPGSKQWVCGLN